jgi:hypothetical protein
MNETPTYVVSSTLSPRGFPASGWDRAMHTAGSYVTGSVIPLDGRITGCG